jgi:hypothetical protein
MLLTKGQLMDINAPVQSSAARVAIKEERTQNKANDATSDIHNPLNLSDRALILRQMEIIHEQDLILVDIERGVNRLHDQVLPFIYLLPIIQ